MWQWKLCPIVLPCLFFLLFASIACSAPTVTTESPQPVSQKPAEFEVGPISLAPPVVMVGDSVTVTATVNNTGDIAGNYAAVLLVDGQEAGRKDIPVDPKSSQVVTFQFSKTTAGSYQLAIGNSSAALKVHNWSPYTIQYDESDGVTDGIYVGGENGHIVRFTPPSKAFNIQTIKIFGMVKNETISSTRHVTVRIWDKDGISQLWSQDLPWSEFLGAEWHEIEVPDVRVNDDFQVELVTHSDPKGGDPIDFYPIVRIDPVLLYQTGKSLAPLVLIGFDYPQSYISSPSNRPETRSGYSYMGKPFDPGQKRLEGIRWLIRVDGEGPPDS